MARWHAVVLAVALAGCGNSPGGPNGPPPPPPGAPPFRPVISDPTAGTAPGPVSGGVAAGVAYVSLARGSVPDGESVAIANRRVGAVITGAVIEGGFDPVPIVAGAGDTLQVTVRLKAGGELSAPFAVPPGRRLIVLRTDPPPGKRDVPLNTNIIVVFSEPVDPATLNAGAIRLRRGGDAVPVQADVVAGSPWLIRIAPGAPLAPAAEYELLLGTGVRDLDGDGLEAETVVTFTTASLAAATGSVIAFVSTRDGGLVAGHESVPWIYLASPDGSSVHRLIQGEAPAWSPDGERLAFHRWNGGASGVGTVELIICNRDGSGQRVLVEGGIYPVWSPDGTRIVYSTGVGVPGAGIYVVNVAGPPAPRRLIDYDFAPDEGYGPGWVGFPNWSPDGSRISFVRADYGVPWQVFLMKADGSDPRLLTLANVGDSPRWSPDGSRLLLTVLGSIASIAVDGSSLVIHASASYLGDAVWSWGGGGIAYTSFVGPPTSTWPVGTRMRIFAAALNGEGRIQLIPEAVNPANPEYWDTEPALWQVGLPGDPGSGAGDWDYLRVLPARNRVR